MFMKVVKYPYGYLFIDLKPFTPENQRLKCIEPGSHNTVQPVDHVTRQEIIKEEGLPEVNHSAVGTQTGHIEEPVNSLDYLKNNSEDIMENKGHACDDCGQLFDTVHDVQRHVKRGWCPESNEPASKKMKTDDNEISSEINENEGYLHLWQAAQRQSKDRYNALYDKYIEGGENEDEAAEMADERIQPYREKLFFGKYQSLLELYLFPLRTNTTHRSIVEKIDDLRNKGASLSTAVKRVLKKYKNDFADLFGELLSDTESADETDSEEESDTE
ncbi:hypothetical protein ACF0H5_009414 [Mactra antiquata]